jgi:hypothetical protein
MTRVHPSGYYLRTGLPALLAACLLASPAARPAQAQALGAQRISRADLQDAYRARRDSLIDYYAGRVPAGDYAQGGYIDIAARLYRGRDLDWVLARLDTLLQDPRGDMFWMYPMVLVTFLGQDLLPPAYQQRMRELWRTYTPYRGDTENHWAMYYAALYLITQRYPGEPGTAWFNGKSSQENHAEARDYLLHWMALTTTEGQGEYDSPDYFGVYVVPMAQLYAWAEEPEMKQRAGMMLDYLLADFAAESLGGLYVGGHSRIYPEPLLDRFANNSTGFAWLLFGNTPFYARGEAFILAASGYVPPAILYHIATDRSQPYVHRERKRTRHRIRYSDTRDAPVYKTTFMTEAYALASLQGGLLQPIQQHTWELLWAPDDPQAGSNLLFTLHPYASPRELGMYFPEEPKLLTEAVVKAQKETYDAAEKWTGASPFEQVFQHRDALVVLYDIAEGTRFPFISGFFSKELTRLEEDPSGWIFAQGGEALIAYYPLAPYTWRTDPDGHRRLHSSALHNGALVQLAPAASFERFADFKAAVQALPLQTETEPLPRVEFETLSGARLRVVYGEVPEVDGAEVDYGSWPLYGGPYLEAEVGSGRLLMKYGRMRRLLDFEGVEVREWVEGG